MRSDSLRPLAFVLVTLMAAACTDGSSADDEANDTSPDPAWPMAESELPHDQSPQVEANDQAILADDNHALSLDLYHELRVDEGKDMGFSVSAYSLQSAFGMLYAGTVEPAASEMAATLHFSLPGESQHVALNWLDQQLRSRNLPAIDGPEPQDPVLFETANGVWAQAELAEAILPSYLDVLATHYDTGVALADFAGATEQERLDINLWVSNRTHTLVPELFVPNIITSDTTMVLVNAIYLRAPWAEPFEASATGKADFTRLDGSVVQVDMMAKYDLTAGYGEGVGYQALAIPLRGGALELVAIVPTDFAAFEAALDPVVVGEVLANLDYSLVTTKLPRFTIDADFALKSELMALGMSSAFVDPGSFAGILPGGPGIITEVVHHTVIAVDEKGTEAAAATGIVIGEGGGEPFYSVSVDRPFIVLLRDVPTDTWLFFGRVLDPSA